MGGFMMVLWLIRFFVFKLYESPKYLMGRGRDQDAVIVVHEIARYNGVHSSLTVGELKDAENVGAAVSEGEGEHVEGIHAGSIVRQHLSKFDSNHVYPLFATRKLAFSTSLLIILWGESRMCIKSVVNR
jgi:hypothetical protein